MSYDKDANERSREDTGQIIIGIAVFVLLIFVVRYGVGIMS